MLKKIFDLDNPLMRFLSRAADLMAVNLLTLLCCIPIVTAGASLTAMYTIELRWARGEEGYIIKPFFKAFKDNFKQATLEWLIALAAAFVFYIDYTFFQENPDTFPQVFQILVLVIGVFLLLVFLWVIPLQCRFENTIGGTFRNAAILAVGKAPRSVGMLACWVIAVFALWLSLTTELVSIFPLVFLFGLSLPEYLCCKLVRKPFSAYEPEEEEESFDELSDEEKEEAYRVLREESPLAGPETEE